MFQFKGDIKVVLNRALAAPGDKPNVIKISIDRFFNPILNKGFIHYGHHLFGHGFCCRQKSGAITCGWKQAFSKHLPLPS